MRRLILSIVPALLIAMVSLANIGGCTGGETCDIRFTEFENGSSQVGQDSEWSCINGGDFVFTIAFFGDGTGTRSDAGDFTWEQTKCRALDLETDSLESATLDNIEGFVDIIGQTKFGDLAFDQTSDDLGDISVACDYIVLVE